MKRGVLGPSSPWASKRRRSTDVQAYLDALKRVQQELNTLDGACAEAQLRIQREFDAKKEPLLKARAETVVCIPGFWKTALTNHPDVYKSENDAEILSFLESLSVQDNEDDFGSHTIKLQFADGNPFFSEKELVKKIRILEDNTEQITNPAISWASGKKPKTKSLFDYFSADASEDNDLGDVIRKDLWINPYVYFLALPPESLALDGASKDGDSRDDEDREQDEIQELYQDL